MPNPASFGLFIAAALLLLMTPGPAVTYIVTRSVSQGRGAGVVSALGIGLGGLVHLAFAALGLSALLASSALALTFVRLAGGVYLLWLGVEKLRAGGSSLSNDLFQAEPLGRVFWRGVVVNLLNPKTVLFFISFLPQFVNPRGNVALQVWVLGMVFVSLAVCTDSLWALLAGFAASWVRERASVLEGARYLSGTIYIALGLATVLSGHRSDS